MRALPLLLVIALGPLAVAAPTQAGRPDPVAAQPPYVRTVLTAEGSHYRYRPTDAGIRVAAGRLRGADENRREVFHQRGAEVTRDQGSCATWHGATSPMAQEGLAVRIREDGHRRRAVTLTKNTIFNVHYIFNILTWDTARRGDPWRKVGQFDMSGAVGASPTRLYTLPWRVCLRVVDLRVSFLVWPLGRVARPRWGNPTYSRHARLPRTFDVRGRPGWYVGHIPARGRIVYRNLTTW
ncbi:hypothetical protein [Nocardioides mangrovi]|uniref:Uncharacterized protein n=1 Tax=Nocardioides mangrovi TaxID=2874580 RepID=A0ABS7UC97_9ACTN|nr:hypothetical protein [Nocardioides mangrovi]MBZ5738601.1 hypothetical protein [Nocardioides mangrovi]